MQMPLTKEQQAKAVDSIKKAKLNLVNFRSIMLATGEDECKASDFHYKWSDMLLNGKENEAIEGFRESAKTQYVLRSFPLYALTFPCVSRDYIVIIKNNQQQARNKLKEIETEYLTNPVIKGNLVRVREQSGDVFSVDVMNETGEIINIRIEAYGKGASIRGLANIDRRPKIVIIDDPQDVEDVRSDTVQDNDWNWFLSDVIFLGQYTRIFIIANNLGERCIIERIFANAKELNFRTHRVPIMEADSNTTNWPEKYTPEFVENEKQGYINMGKLDIWLRERMCVAVNEETRIFKEEYFNWYSPGIAVKIAGNSSVYATLDPASSSKQESCFRAIVVNAVQPDGHWYILEVLYGRWDTVQLLEMIFAAVVRWGIIRFGIEKGQLQQTYEPLIYREMTQRNVRFNLEALEHGKEGNKLQRIKNLQPRFKSRSVWFPDDAPWLPELKSELAGVTKDEIKSQFIDLVDALAMQEQLVRVPYAGAPVDRFRQKQLPRMALR